MQVLKPLPQPLSVNLPDDVLTTASVILAPKAGLPDKARSESHELPLHSVAFICAPAKLGSSSQGILTTTLVRAALCIDCLSMTACSETLMAHLVLLQCLSLCCSASQTCFNLHLTNILQVAFGAFIWSCCSWEPWHDFTSSSSSHQSNYNSSPSFFFP